MKRDQTRRSRIALLTKRAALAMLASAGVACAANDVEPASPETVDPSATQPPPEPMLAPDSEPDVDSDTGSGADPRTDVPETKLQPDIH